MENRLSRRNFLKVAGYAMGGFALRPPPADKGNRPVALGRVTVDQVQIYREPSYRAPHAGRYYRDELVSLLARLIADEGPLHNPNWYLVADGYVHSGNLQVVEWKPQSPILELPPNGALFEISVPYTRTYRKPDPASDPLYRFYYKAAIWVEDVVEGADGRYWYRLLDDLLKVRYYARAEHLRLVPHEELAPLSPEVPLQHKRIEVSLTHQELYCYEFQRLVFRTRISSGVTSSRPPDNGIPTNTPKGRFFVEVKMPARHMGDGKLTSDLSAYELPGVPWVSFFTTTGVAFHGVYWHNDFGRPRSHGCINMRADEAKWLYRWTLPIVAPNESRRIARGTPVIVL